MSAHDLIIHNYGPSMNIGTVNVEIDCHTTVGELYPVLHHLQMDILKKHRIYLVFGIYSVDPKSENTAKLRGIVERYVTGNIHMREDVTFEMLVESIEAVHENAGITAKSVVNRSLTLRNWIIGYYIVEFEQNGKSRAEYGKSLLKTLADSINIKGLDRQMLNSCRIFYFKYPQICDSASHILGASASLSLSDRENNDIVVPIPAERPTDGICDSVSRKFETPADMLINKLSFTHIRQLLPIEDSFERFFYEIECIKNGWSVRELERQISSKLYFRTGISKNPDQLLSMIVSEDGENQLTIKDPYVFEFLGLNASDAVTEPDLEQATMDHLQEFLLEMGKGFCFEARQKRIIIDGDYYFADLVLYNRILHCNVIIELKVDKFRYEHFGQLNSYVSYYKECEMTLGDNPPIGILLCTQKGPKMVEYVLNGMDENLFISTYMLQLPDKKQLEEFLLKEAKEMGI